MQGDGFIVEPVTSASGTSQVERGSPRLYGVLFRVLDDLFDGLFYVLKAACCFPLATKRSVSVNIREPKDTVDVNVNNSFDKKDKTIEKKIKFVPSQETVSSAATTVISKCSSITNSGSWISSLRQPDIVEDDYDEYVEYTDRKTLKSKAGMIKNFFTKQIMNGRRGALRKYVPQLKFRRRKRSNSVVVPNSSSETMFSKAKLRNVTNKIFTHRVAREMTLGPEVYPCLQAQVSDEKFWDNSVGKPIKSVVEGKLKRTFSFFNDIYGTNQNE